jgi:hexokinase
MKLNDWLTEQKIAADAYDTEALLAHFITEMEQGLAGEKSSLAMIPAYVSTDSVVPAQTSVAVIDAGGTNLRVCLAQFDDAGKIELSGFSKQPMPGRDHELSAADFYAILADALEPLKDQFTHIGFCFSYPATILPNYDGRLLHWTKEIKIPELVGQPIAAGLLTTLEARGISGKTVVILNDTVATLLAGMAQGQQFGASSYIGFILGTGTNTAYVERNEKIGKLAGSLRAGTQVINVESGGFAVVERGPFDQQLDACSENPNVHIFEKLIAGVYLGPLTLELLQAPVPQTLFSDRGAEAIAKTKTLSTIHIDNLAANNGRDTGVLNTDLFTDADRELMKTVFNRVVDRAALLTAVNIAAAVVKSGEGKSPDHPVCINIDGSTYYKTHQLASKVQAQLRALLTPRDLHIHCVQVDDAPVVGAAIAALTTF